MLVLHSLFLSQPFVQPIKMLFNWWYISVSSWWCFKTDPAAVLYIIVQL